jgi:hypothetical protein
MGGASAHQRARRLASVGVGSGWAAPAGSGPDTGGWSGRLPSKTSRSRDLSARSGGCRRKSLKSSLSRPRPGRLGRFSMPGAPGQERETLGRGTPGPCHSLTRPTPAGWTTPPDSRSRRSNPTGSERVRALGGSRRSRKRERRTPGDCVEVAPPYTLTCIYTLDGVPPRERGPITFTGQVFARM